MDKRYSDVSDSVLAEELVLEDSDVTFCIKKLEDIVVNDGYTSTHSAISKSEGIEA